MNRDEVFLKLYSSGLTLAEIGKRYGITHQRVQEVLSEYPEYFLFKKERIEKKHPIRICICGKEFRADDIDTFSCSRMCGGATKIKKFDERNAHFPRRCNRCRKLKQPNEFYPRYGKYANNCCRTCHKFFVRRWKERNPEKWAIINRRAGKKYREKIKKVASTRRD